MPVQNVKQPTYMRYARVEAVLSQELAFRDRLTAKTEAVLKPDGEKELFAPQVIAITQLIHDGGKDAHKCQKIDVIRAAVSVFKIGENEDAAPVTQPVPATPPPQPAPKAAPKKPVAAPKPPVKAVAPKPPAKPPAKPVKAAAPAKPKALPAPSAPEAPKSKSTPEVKKDETEKVIKEAVASGKISHDEAVHNPLVAIYSLLITALQNCDMFDSSPGKDKRLKTLDDLAVEYLGLIQGKGAKESKKAQ